jgi:transcriptional regulator with XRE-family HTH domain
VRVDSEYIGIGQFHTLSPVVKLTRLRAVRERKALTQDELASMAGVSRQTVLKIEGGLEPRPPTIRKLAAALGVQPADLMEPAESQP